MKLGNSKVIDKFINNTHIHNKKGESIARSKNVSYISFVHLIKYFCILRKPFIHLFGKNKNPTWPYVFAFIKIFFVYLPEKHYSKACPYLNPYLLMSIM